MIGEQEGNPTLIHTVVTLYQAPEGPLVNFVCFVKDFHKIQHVIADLESNICRSETFFSHALYSFVLHAHQTF